MDIEIDSMILALMVQKQVAVHYEMKRIFQLLGSLSFSVKREVISAADWLANWGCKFCFFDGKIVCVRGLEVY